MIDVGVGLGERTGEVPLPVPSDLGAALVAALVAMFAVLLAYDPAGTAAPVAPMPDAAVPDVVVPPTAPVAPPRSAGASNSHVLAAGPMTGFSSAPVLDAAGRLWITHIDDARRQVVVVRCADTACTTSQHHDLAAGERVPFGLDVAPAPTGLVASYLELDPRPQTAGEREHRLVLAHCTDACAQVESVVLAERLPEATTTAVALDAEGRARVAFRGADGRLHLLHCVDPACARSTTQVLTIAGVGDHLDLALTSAGHPVVASRSDASGGLQVTICGDADCRTRTTREVGAEGGGQRSSLALTATGEIVVAHKFSDGLELVWCGDDCLAPRRRVLADGFAAGNFPTLRLHDGLPVVSYYDEDLRAPMLASCLDTACERHTRAVVDDRGTAGEQLGMTIAADGAPVLTYHDRAGSLLRLTRCASAGCGSARPLSDTDAIDVVRTVGAPVLVHHGPSGVTAVSCGRDGCVGAAETLDLGGIDPAETVATIDHLGALVVAMRGAEATEASVHVCADTCSEVVTIAGVSRLVSLRAAGDAGLEVVHLDLDGDLVATRCTTDCGPRRLLGTPGAHADVVGTSGPAGMLVSWRERSSGDVWTIRCEPTCDAAPRVVGSWPEGGAIEVALADDGAALLAVELPAEGRTELWSCVDTRCRLLTVTAGRPLSLVADGPVAGLLVADAAGDAVVACEDACVRSELRLGVELMMPTLVGASPPVVVGRDRVTREVVTLACDQRGCGVDDAGTSSEVVGVS